MDRFAAFDGTPLACRISGSGEPLICLPGGPMRAAAYLGDLGGLTVDRRLVLLDPRGTGASGAPADPDTYRCDRQVDDIEALRLRLGLPGLDLLAHSEGGDTALLYAARHPDRVRGLVLVTARARARALGIDFTGADRRAAEALRADEPWYASARGAYAADRDIAAPFFYGRAASTPRPPRSTRP
ncbi:alpha/beta fold hydrolase [Streptomyces sp. NPDC058953]|uniref:alpha/beta fold hydrolase n=1 Tax=unclassified Streptomyces TaxID=2593676 RepID=UPI0036B93236